MDNKTNTWFLSWFDTPFYHILYKDRDASDAKHFMDTLTNYLNIPEGGAILDLACGQGRHSRYLNTLGYNVTGIDLSENNIVFAKTFENATLHFEVHNMCQTYPKTFDAVFNLFTSFGYFENDCDNLNTIKAIKSNLNETGFGVIDFMNTNFVIDNLIPEETKLIDNIAFNLKRYSKNGYIFKDINFNFNGTTYNFRERVRAFTLNDFEMLFKEANMYLLDVFGNYKLDKYNPKTSERLVMIFK